MLEQGQHENMTAFFGMMDVSGDGALTRDDVLAVAAKVITTLSLAGSPKAGAITDAYAAMWEAIVSHGDTDGNGSVSVEEFLALVEAGEKAGDDYLDTTYLGVSDALFDGCDTNGDGVIELAEYLAMYGTVDQTQFATATFDRMDTDGDGAISRDEYLADLRGFFSGSATAAA